MRQLPTAPTKKISSINAFLSPMIMALLVSLVTGCTPLSLKNFEIPMEQSDTIKDTNQGYYLQPHDILNVIYHFHSLGNKMYQISPHDRLNIKFFSVPDYDDIYQVRPDGYISLPQLGEFKAQGRTVAEIQEQLESSYCKILKQPTIFVSLAEYQVHMKELRDSLADPRMGHARLITVRDDYKITLPLIGEMNIREKSLQTITREANSKYKNKAPGIGVDILLQESQPRNIYIFGAVKSPGNHKIQNSISIYKALALAGGATSEANLDTVVILKREDDTMVARKYNFTDLLSGRGKATVLNPEDILYVPKSRLSTTAEVMRHISDVLLFNGFDLGFNYRLDE